MKLNLAKILTLLVWLLILLSLTTIFPVAYRMPLQYLGLFLLGAHFVEYLLFKEKIAKKPEGPLLAFVMTMLFGVFYWKYG